MNVLDEQIETAIVERAAEWYARHRDGALTAAETEAFLQWLQASPLHVREYLAAATVAGRLSEAIADKPTDRRELIQRARDWLRSGGNVVALRPSRLLPTSGLPLDRQTSKRAMLSIAAAVAMVMITSAIVYLSANQLGLSGWPRTVDVPQGEQRTLRLRDGSVLHLNSGTQVRVRYSRAQRLIELSQGRALFNVAKNPARPFVVRAGAADIVAVGTQFDVSKETPHSQVTVTVVEGKVDVVDRQPRTGAASVGSISEPVRLGAGQQLRLGSSAVKPVPKVVDVRLATAWLRRELVFSEQRLSEVAEAFSRYGVPIEIEDRALREYRVSGVFDAYDTESFVTYLRRLGRVERTGESIRVVARSGDR